VWQLSRDVPNDNVGPLNAEPIDGCFAPEIEQELLGSTEALNAVARSLVEGQFPLTIAPDVLSAVGLDPDIVFGSPAASISNVSASACLVDSASSASVRLAASIFATGSARAGAVLISLATPCLDIPSCAPTCSKVSPCARSWIALVRLSTRSTASSTSWSTGMVDRLQLDTKQVKIGST